jgi:hypothetical protein
MQKRRINKSVESINSKKLSIQFSLDGFSFCIYTQDDTIINFSEFDFEKTAVSPENLLDKIEAIFASEVLLQQDFTEVFAVHQNQLSTIVPDPFFNPKNVTEYLKYSIKILNDDLIAFDHIASISAKSVYVPYVNINNYIFQNFGEFEYKHHLSVLIEKLITQNTAKEETVFVNVFKNDFDIIVLKEKELIFSNSFSLTTKEDFIYYILFTLEQLKLAPEKVLLCFLGTIEKESELYTIVYKYVRNVTFLKNPSHFFTNETSISNHSNYILIN